MTLETTHAATQTNSTSSDQSSTRQTGGGSLRSTLSGLSFGAGTALLKPPPQSNLTPKPKTGPGTRLPLDLQNETNLAPDLTDDVKRTQAVLALNALFSRVNAARLARTDGRTIAPTPDDDRGLVALGYQGRFTATGTSTTTPKTGTEAETQNGGSRVGVILDEQLPGLAGAGKVGELEWDIATGAVALPPAARYLELRDGHGKPAWIAEFGFDPTPPVIRPRPIYTEVETQAPLRGIHSPIGPDRADAIGRADVATTLYFQLFDTGVRDYFPASVLPLRVAENQREHQRLFDYYAARAKFIADYGKYL